MISWYLYYLFDNCVEEILILILNDMHWILLYFCLHWCLIYFSRMKLRFVEKLCAQFGSKRGIFNVGSTTLFVRVHSPGWRGVHEINERGSREQSKEKKGKKKWMEKKNEARVFKYRHFMFLKEQYDKRR